MKKKFLKVLVLVLVWLLLFIGSATIVIYRDNKEVAKIQAEEYIANEHIENIELENESNDNNTIPEIITLETEESNNDEQTEKNTEEHSKETVVSKPKTETQETVTSKSKTETQEKSTNTNSTPTKDATNSSKVTEDKPKQTETTTKEIVPSPTPSAETSKEQNPFKCEGNKHVRDVGNCGKWFNTQTEAMAYYNSIIASLGKALENFEITEDEYDKKCPFRAEPFSCTCGKWSIDFSYRKK